MVCVHQRFNPRPKLTWSFYLSGALYPCHCNVLSVVLAAPITIIVSLARLYARVTPLIPSCSPDQCHLIEIRGLVEQLAVLLAEGT